MILKFKPFALLNYLIGVKNDFEQPGMLINEAPYQLDLE